MNGQTIEKMLKNGLGGERYIMHDLKKKFFEENFQTENELIVLDRKMESVAGNIETKDLHYDPLAVEEDVYPLRPIKVAWKVVDGVMTYQHPGMIGRVELLGEGTPADPCRFSWSVAWTTGSGQPIFSGEEKNLESACKQVEYHFDPAVISAQVQSLIVKASEQTIDFMQPDMINCRHKQEDHCECICHQHKGIVIHDRACCNPCMGCGFREVMR